MKESRVVAETNIMKQTLTDIHDNLEALLKELTRSKSQYDHNDYDVNEVTEEAIIEAKAALDVADKALRRVL